MSGVSTVQTTTPSSGVTTRWARVCVWMCVCVTSFVSSLLYIFFISNWPGKTGLDKIEFGREKTSELLPWLVVNTPLFHRSVSRTAHTLPLTHRYTAVTIINVVRQTIERKEGRKENKNVKCIKKTTGLLHSCFNHVALLMFYCSVVLKRFFLNLVMLAYIVQCPPEGSSWHNIIVLITLTHAPVVLNLAVGEHLNWFHCECSHCTFNILSFSPAVTHVTLCLCFLGRSKPAQTQLQGSSSV